jgi:integrin beta 3
MQGAAGEPGRDGKDGQNGADGKSITVEELRPMIEAECAKYLLNLEQRAHGIIQQAIERIPAPRDGKDGVNGKDGTSGVNGRDGKDGMDGKDGAVGIVGRDGANGKDGINGRDGFNLTDFVLEYDGERTLNHKFIHGDLVKVHSIKLPIVLDRGIFSDGRQYENGDGVSFGGSFWIAQTQTTNRPGEGNSDWRLAIKRGRDGRDGERGPIGPAGQNGRNGKDLTQLGQDGSKW